MSTPVVSLFSGAGGLDYGFLQEGFTAVAAFDADPAAVISYNFNLGDSVARVCDLSASNGDEIVHVLKSATAAGIPRGVLGGPPCQSFSIGNAYTKSDDIRHTLPKSYARILKRLNAEYNLDFFIFENVRGLADQRHRAEFDGFKTLFRDAGFELFEAILDAQYYGVPQKRQRLFVVGFNADKFRGWEFRFPTPFKGPVPTVADAIGSLPPPQFYMRGMDASQIAEHPNHCAMRPKSEKFRGGFLTSGQTKGKSFRVLNWDKPSYTVAYGHNEVHVHPSGTRRLSIYEAMLLQGFPTSYRLLGTLTDQIRQVSNAVPPPMARELAKAIRLFLAGDPRYRVPKHVQASLL